MLEEVTRVFDISVRPNATKVLVIISDKSSGLDTSSIKRAAKPLTSRRIHVIPVSVGDEIDPNELQQTTTDPNSSVHVPVDVTSRNLAGKIIVRVFKGRA